MYKKGDLLFQFHTGSIKSCRQESRTSGSATGFNSTLVRLKEHINRGPGAFARRVSIPHWFD